MTAPCCLRHLMSHFADLCMIESCGPDSLQNCFDALCKGVAYAAGDASVKQKTPEAVTEAGSKVASAVTEAGEYY